MRKQIGLGANTTAQSILKEAYFMYFTLGIFFHVYNVHT